MDAATHFVLLPGLDGTGELFAPLLQALGDDVTSSVVRYVAELTLDEYVESAAKALPDRCALRRWQPCAPCHLPSCVLDWSAWPQRMCALRSRESQRRRFIFVRPTTESSARDWASK